MRRDNAHITVETDNEALAQEICSLLQRHFPQCTKNIKGKAVEVAQTYWKDNLRNFLNGKTSPFNGYGVRIVPEWLVVKVTDSNVFTIQNVSNIISPGQGITAHHILQLTLRNRKLYFRFNCIQFHMFYDGSKINGIQITTEELAQIFNL